MPYEGWIVFAVFIVIVLLAVLFSKIADANKKLNTPKPIKKQSTHYISKQKYNLMVELLSAINECVDVEDEIDLNRAINAWIEGRLKAAKFLRKKDVIDSLEATKKENNDKEKSLLARKESIRSRIKNVTPSVGATVAQKNDLSIFSANYREGILGYLLSSPKCAYTNKKTTVVFLANYILLLNGTELSLERYSRLSLLEFSTQERLNFSRAKKSDDEVVRTFWLHEKKAGGPDRRYSYNPQGYIVFRGQLKITFSNQDFIQLSYSNRAKAHNAFLVFDRAVKALVGANNAIVIDTIFKSKNFISIEEAKKIISETKESKIVKKTTIEITSKKEELETQLSMKQPIVVSAIGMDTVTVEPKVQNSTSEDEEMANQPQWNIYETSLLIEAYFDIKFGADRIERLTILSTDLRNMAILRGEEMDDVYRNLNGMIWQSKRIAQFFDPEEGEYMKPSHIFSEGVELYRNHRKQFDLVLEEAHRRCGKEQEDLPVTTPTTRDISEFKDWLQTNEKLALNTANSYMSSILAINELALNKKITEKALWLISDKDALITIASNILDNSDFCYKNMKMHNAYTASLRKFLSFMGIDNFVKRSKAKKQPINQPVAEETIKLVVSFDSDVDYAYTKPDSISYFGVIKSNISSWKEVFSSTVIAMSDDYSQQLYLMADDQSNDFYSRSDSVLRYPIKIFDDLFIETNLSANSIVRRIKDLLDFCGVAYENLVINYSKKKEQEEVLVAPVHVSEQAEEQEPQQEVERSIKPSEEDLMILTIIEENYNKGFLPGAINYKKIRRYYETKCEKELSLSNEEIDLSLKRTCLYSSGKYYAFSTLLPEDIKIRFVSYINECFETGKGYIYYKNLFDHFGYELSASMPDVEILKEYLLAQFKQFAYYDDYFAKDYTVTINAQEEVEDILLEAVYPISFDKIISSLPYLTEDVVRKAVQWDGKIICTDGNLRFHVDSLGITTEDLAQIAGIIQQTIDVHGFMFGKELVDSLAQKMPSLYENIKDFGQRGIRGAVSYLLKDKFSFNGNIICPHGKQIDNYSVFKSFAESEKYFTLESLSKLKEQIGVGNIYFDAVNEACSRINENDYVPNAALTFDTMEIDSLLDQLVKEDVASLKEVANFSVYPNTCYPWNKYLLESYVAKYSEKYRLIHNSFNEGKCVGAIVKKSSQIQSLDDVVVDYLVRHNDILNSSSALEMLVYDGYIARKIYKNIDNLLVVAKSKR
jgi:hypothetical protein